MTRVNLKDIATALDVSQSTVSRALRNEPGVNPELRERIFKMAQDLNYPFKLPKNQDSKRIGTIIPDFSNPFFATVCYGIESVLRSNGYLTYLVNTNEDSELEKDYVHSLIDEEVEGLIIAPSANTETLYNKICRTLPLIFFDRHYDSVAVQSVLIDNKDIIFRSVQYLVEIGHRNICLVSGNHCLYTGKSRTDGFREALHLLALEQDCCPVVRGNFKEPEAYEATKNVLTRQDCTAVIATSNKTTCGVLRAIRELGLSIPQDVSVIGFDDQEWMDFSEPPITTIVQPAFTMGTLAASLLLQQINGNSSPENVILKAELKNRKSVQPIVS